ncbi:uncharacterized protein PSFLO_00576 [Pseudozyma flocculosa]|uniref:Uncharacterized protein n=1 Tax=Pseudozyma flocculosa TaxID=84751 RepID=A0A5C3ETW3_9BASI|nr:uncharacterized protein PSFLO_00576 [Pseudozyma flocculosa]
MIREGEDEEEGEPTERAEVGGGGSGGGGSDEDQHGWLAGWLMLGFEGTSTNSTSQSGRAGRPARRPAASRQARPGKASKAGRQAGFACSSPAQPAKGAPSHLAAFLALPLPPPPPFASLARSPVAKALKKLPFPTRRQPPPPRPIQPRESQHSPARTCLRRSPLGLVARSSVDDTGRTSLERITIPLYCLQLVARPTVLLEARRSSSSSLDGRIGSPASPSLRPRPRLAIHGPDSAVDLGHGGVGLLRGWRLLSAWNRVNRVASQQQRSLGRVRLPRRLGRDRGWPIRWLLGDWAGMLRMLLHRRHPARLCSRSRIPPGSAFSVALRQVKAQHSLRFVGNSGQSDVRRAIS